MNVGTIKGSIHGDSIEDPLPHSRLSTNKIRALGFGV